MKEPTIQEVLNKQTKDELWQTAARLGLDGLKKSAKKAEWVEYIANALPEKQMPLYMQMRHEELQAIHEACKRGGVASPIDMPDDAWFVLDDACYALSRYGLAWEEGLGWRIRSSVPELLPLDEDVAQWMIVHDLIYDAMDGLLVHTGMMPMMTLLDETVRMFREQNAGVEDEEEIRDISITLFVSRRDADSLWLDPDNEPWLLNADIQDPEELWKRLQDPVISRIPYPSFDARAMIRSARDYGIPGDKALYEPLFTWMDKNCKGENVEDLMYDLVMLIEHETGSDSIAALMQSAKTTSMKTVDQGCKLLQELMNSMPRWWNKGWSPNEMRKKLVPPGSAPRRTPELLDGVPQVVAFPGGSRMPPMPGRNDLCTCGSGKKYKHCCGKRMN